MATETVNITTTLANDSVTNAKLANMAQGTIKMREAGAGTGDPIDGTPDQASTVLDAATDPFVRTSNLPAPGIQDGDTLAIGLTFPDGGLKVVEEGAGVNTLTIRVDEVFGADRVLNIQMSDADRILHLTGDAKLSGTNTGDQTLNSLLPSQTGNVGEFLTTDGTNASWAPIGGGTGDVVGPASSTDNNVPQWDGITGELLKDGLAYSSGGNNAADGGKLVRFRASGDIYFSNDATASPSISAFSSGTGDGVSANADSGDAVSATSVTGRALHAIAGGAAPSVHANGQGVGIALEAEQNGGGGADIALFHDGSGNGLEVKTDGGLNWTSATGAATSRTGLGLGTLATQSGTFSGTSSGTNTGDQDLSPYQTIAALAADVRAVVLTGLSLASSAAVAATDSILVAFGKLQAFNNLFTTVGLAIARLTNPSAVTFLRMNADNTATARTASEMRTDLALGTAAQVNTGTTTGTVPLVENLYLFTGATLPLIPVSSSAYTWTDHPAALTFFLGQARWVVPVSLTGRSSVNVSIFVPSSGSYVAGSKIRLLYRTKTAGYSSTITDYIQLGASAQVEATFAVGAAYFHSGWIDLAALAKDDILIAVAGIDGNGASDPQFLGIYLEYR